jgi:hypothetical protein
LVEWKINEIEVFFDIITSIKEDDIDNLRYDHPLLPFNVDFTKMDSDNEFKKFMISNSNYRRFEPILCDSISDRLSELMYVFTIEFCY